MSNFFYETLGRVTWYRARRNALRTLDENATRIGIGAALAVGVVAVGAVLARSHAPAE